MLRAITVLSACAVVIAVGVAQPTKDAAGTTSVITKKPELRPSCKYAERAIVYYRQKTWSYQDKLEQERHATSHPERRKNACPYKRYAARVWEDYTISTREQWEAYLYDYGWWLWLPDKWQRIAHCETHKGRYIPGDWHHNSGTNQGAFGFYYGTWDRYKPTGAPSEAYLATPRQQYEAALNVYAAHGYEAWGCGDA